MRGSAESALKAVKAALIVVAAVAAGLSAAAAIEVRPAYALGVVVWALIALAAARA
ncbi:MAG: hypothetical protein GSR80_000925 [Desulfurococcales archaeon]|nr:hypothetical protein [Desulfurococcales archaeon]